MRVDFSQLLMAMDGKTPIKETDQPGSKDFSLAMAATNSLLATYHDENLSGDDKAKRFKLALLLVGGGQHDLSVEDVALLKRLIGKSFGPLVVGRAFAALEAENDQG